MQEAHALLAEVALQHGCASSALIGSVSRHVMPSTVSFKTLATLHASAKSVKLEPHRCQACVYFASSGADLCVSFKFTELTDSGAQAGAQATQRASTAAAGGSKKRKRDVADEQILKVQRVVGALRKRHGDVDELDRAEASLTRLVRDVRGPSGELLVEGVSVLSRKLKEENASTSIVLALRFHAGVAIPLGAFKHALGAAWKDGVVSAEVETMGVTRADVPQTDEGRASEQLGNAPLLVVTAIPKE